MLELLRERSSHWSKWISRKNFAKNKNSFKNILDFFRGVESTSSLYDSGSEVKLL